MTILVPVLYFSYEINYFVADFFFQRFLFILAIAIPFDIRDLKHDNVQYRTIPQVLGVVKSKWFAALMLSIFVFLMLLVSPGLLPNVMFYIAVSAQLVLITLMNEKRSDAYCAGLIDGAIALLGISYFF